MSDAAAVTRRALIVAWPGADRAVLGPMIEAGLLPNLSLLVDRGVSGALVPVPPPVPIASWGCMITGCWAHHHGLLHEKAIGPQGEVEWASLASLRVPAIWETVRAAGASASQIGWESESPDASGADSAEVAAALRAMVVDPDEARSLQPEWMRRLREAVADSLRSARDAIEALPSHALVAVRFRGLGVLARDFARFDPPAPGWVVPERARLFAQVFRQAWRLHDELLGALVAAMGSGRVIMLASESGLDLAALRVAPDAEHGRGVRPGFLLMAGPGIRGDALMYGATVPATCATLLAAMGLPTDHCDVGPVAGVMTEAAPSPSMRGQARPSSDVRMGLSADLSSPEVRGVMQARARNLARSWMLQGAWRQAMLALEEAGGELDAEHLQLRVRCRLAQRQIPEARREIDQWHALEPRPSARLDSLEASVRLVEDRPEGAHQRIREAIARHGESAELLVDLAEVLLRLKREPEATSACLRAIELDVGMHAAHAMLTRCHHEAARFNDAAEAARSALALRFMDPEMHFLRGTALAAAGRPHEAVESLFEAVRQRPDFPAAYRRLAAVHLRQLGNHGAAEGFMEAARQAEVRLRDRSARAQ